MAEFPYPNDRALVALRKWAVLLDNAFQVPGTKFRFGLDPIIGLVPGAGDIVTGFFSVMILAHAVRLRIPKVVIARMVINAGLDMLAGAVPLLGDLFDAGYKANLRNLLLLERHAHPGVPVPPGERTFVVIAIAVIIMLAIVPLVIVGWVLMQLSQINWL